MNTRIRLVILALLIGVGCVFLLGNGCRKPLELPIAGPPTADRMMNLVPHSPLSFSVPQRVLGRSSEPACPPAQATESGHWAVSPVFVSDGKSLPRSMRELCAYHWYPATAGSPPAIDALPRSRLTNVTYDLPIVVALGTVGDVMMPRLCDRRQRLFHQAEGVYGFPHPDSVTLGPVHVGFPDSSPRPPQARPDDITLGSNPHGFNIAWITRSLTCSQASGGVCADDQGPNGDCFVRPHMVRALDRSHPSGPVLPDDGKQSGTHTGLIDFARAIRMVLSEAKKGEPLILNLAAGWEPQLECASSPLPPPSETTDSSATQPDGSAQLGQLSSSDELPSPPSSCPNAPEASPGVKAVYYALLEAACQGALIIAAAGNDTGYNPAIQGPMLPAAWERIPFSPDQCVRWFGNASSPAPQTAYRPLVHAVGGVGDNDLPIVNSRPKGQPRLVAPASLGVGFPNTAGDSGYGTDDTGGGAPHVACSNSYLLTGTSVATAVASAAAAAVWAYRPDLSGQDVMEIVYRSGADLGMAADFCMGDTECATIHRIAICRAVKMACAPPAPLGTANLSRCTSVAALSCAPERPPGKYGSRIPSAPVDGGTNLNDLPPAEAFTTARGQPGRPNCPTCSLNLLEGPTSRWNITGDVDVQTLNGGTLSQPLLQLYAVNGNPIPTITAVFTQSTWSEGSQTTVALNNPVEASNVATATITWTLTAGSTTSTVTQEIYIQLQP